MKKLIDKMTSVKKYGTEDVTITVLSAESGEAFDPADGGVSPFRTYEENDIYYSGSNTYPIAVINSSYSDYLVSKGTLEISDVKLTVALFAVDPTIGSSVLIGNIGYTVMNVRKLSVQGNVIGWQLQLRV